jgi:hypothetical protein
MPPENEIIESPATPALAAQVGGNHYKDLVIQPAEYIALNNISYLAGNAIKYLTRYKKKGGAEDIKKARHYCDLVLEIEYKQAK